MEATLNTSVAANEKFVSSFSHFKSALLQSQPAMVERAKAALLTQDFPTTRAEDWKYTRTARIAHEAWSIIYNAAKVDITPYLIPNLNAEVIVFVNGFLRDDLSDYSNALDVSIKADQTHEAIDFPCSNIFQSLNAAYSTAVLHIHIAKNKVGKTPLHIAHIMADEMAMAQPIITIHAEKSAELEVVETFACVKDQKTFCNRLLNVHVDENASVSLHKIQAEGDQSFLMNEDSIHIEKNGRFTINTLTIDGGWVRNNLNISLDGENIETHLNGIFLPRRKQFVDNHSKVDHRFPNCNSNELYKGILNDHSVGVFNGKVYVQPDAQKTNAFQSNKNVLLSNEAQMNTKPELEIYADDVKCSHGTTTGQMDDSALFYLKSRGLGDESARKLLSTAFVNDVISKVDNEAVREYVIDELVKRDLLFV
jgi:Fe-S cluster assembly protein SufD